MQSIPSNPALQSTFREAMSACAAGVHVITTNGSAGRYGITMTALAAVTDSPPTILLCINTQARILPLIQANRHLCINVLNADQQDVAKHFAGITRLSPEERFAQHIWSEGPTGQLEITDALAQLHGEISESSEIGSHCVLFVRIHHINIPNPEGEALTYFRRQFGTASLAPIDTL